MIYDAVTTRVNQDDVCCSSELSMAAQYPVVGMDVLKTDLEGVYLVLVAFQCQECGKVIVQPTAVRELP